MEVALSTAFARSLDPRATIDAALRAGAAGLLLDATLPADALGELLALRGDLPVWAIENPCPATRAAAAELASVDRDEATVAIETAESTIGRAADVGARFVALRLGEVAALRRDWPAVRRAFLRAALDEKSIDRFQRERAQRAPRHLDAARRALDCLARRAEMAGVVLVIRNPNRAFGLPSPDELALLLADFLGAPVAPALDLAAAHLDEVMGFRPVATVLAAWSGSPLALLADACGPVIGLPPGHGELDLPAALAALPASARLAFHPSSNLTPDEVTLGVNWFSRAPGPAPGAPLPATAA